jgi:ABC-type sugar transport system permease subunit
VPARHALSLLIFHRNRPMIHDRRTHVTIQAIALFLARRQLETRHHHRRICAHPSDRDARAAMQSRLLGRGSAMAALVAAAFVVNAYRKRYYGGLLVAPAIAVLFVMNIFPLLWSLGLSFFAYQSNQQSIRFVGLNNYIKVLTNDIAAPANWDALINTGMFVVFTVAAQMVVGFLLAMLFSKQFPLRKYLLILVLTPMMLSVVASGVFFTYYFDPTFGILSYVVGEITGNQFILMDNKVGAVAGVVFADAWMWSPFVMLLVLAGLVSVPKYLYEAAAIDRVSKMAAVLDNHLPLHPRPPDACAAVPHDRGLQALRSCLHSHPRRAGHQNHRLSHHRDCQRTEQDK